MSELETALVELITKTVEQTGEATDFILAETPEYIQQLLFFKMIVPCVFFSVACAFAFLAWKLIHLKISIVKLDDKDKPNWCWYLSSRYRTSLAYDFVFTAGVLCGVTSLFIGVASVINILKIAIAPKVYLVEYAAGLIK